MLDRRQDVAVPEFLVGIGASAGGLEALESLFENLTRINDVAFVVVTHLSPSFESLLDELLGRRTEMPVIVVENAMPLEAGNVYVLPPKFSMTVERDCFVLSGRDSAQSPLPIDVFFSSMARSFGGNSIGVILSGSGEDGANGIESISRSNGFVIAQEPTSAKFSSMPEAAIRVSAH